MATRDTSLPPLPPELQPARTPAMQFVQGGGAAGGPVAQPQGASANGTAEQVFKSAMEQAAQNLATAGQALVLTHPELMPIYQRMVSAGKLLMDQVDQMSQGQQPGGSPAEPAPSQEAASAISMS